jgi:hypothetical protein
MTGTGLETTSTGRNSMAGMVATQLRAKADAAWSNLGKQLQGMEAHLDTSDAPGQWTTRQVLSHLLFQPEFDPVGTLKTFARSGFPTFDIVPGEHHCTGTRTSMTLRQFVDALDRQRQSVFGYLDGLSDADLQERKARIPLFKQIMGVDEVPIATFTGALFDYHWNDHAGQLAKIRKAAGLPGA